MSHMKGKVAFVTGGTSGIGRETAITFARHGAKVAVTGRREAEGQETVALVKKAGGEGVFIRADVAKTGEVENAVNAAVKAFGRIDCAFNNAGVDEALGPMHEKGEDVWDHIIDINMKGLWRSMKAEVVHMLSRSGGGAIVNCASIAGVVGFGGASIYCASKHGVIGLTKAASLEYAAQGIRINAIGPAAIETAMIDRMIGEGDLREQVAAMHPIGRMGRPEEIADAVLWLCSDASSFIVGHTLLADGGFTAR